MYQSLNSLPSSSYPITHFQSKPNNPKQASNRTSNPKWLSFEFIIYYLILSFALYKAISSGLKVSSPYGNPNFDKVQRYLSKGWLSEYVDNSDTQFSSFRANIPKLTMLMAIFCFCSLVLKSHMKESYLYVLGFTLLLFLHGLNSIFIVLLMTVNYMINIIGNKYHLKLIPILTWSWALFSLLGSEWLFHKITFKTISFGYLSYLDNVIFKGGYHRWWVIYNISVLRMISFNMDYYYSLLANRSITSEDTFCKVGLF